MSNDNLQGMPPKPPVQPNQPPAPPTNPTMSRLTPPVPPQQTASTTMLSQPPAPPNANSTQSAPQPQQQDSTAWQQPNYTAPPTTPNSQNSNTQSSIDNFLANAKKFDIKDLIELKSKPEHNIGNFIGQTFCSFWRFDACSTRYDWWLGQVVLLLILVPASGVLNRWYYLSRHTIVDQEIPNPLLLLISAAVAIYVIVAEIALTIRRLRDTGSSPWMILFPLINIPANLIAGSIAIIIGPLFAYILAIFVGIIGIAIPLVTSAFTPSQIINIDKPRYMVFHWEKLFG